MKEMQALVDGLLTGIGILVTLAASIWRRMVADSPAMAGIRSADGLNE